MEGLLSECALALAQWVVLLFQLLWEQFLGDRSEPLSMRAEQAKSCSSGLTDPVVGPTTQNGCRRLGRPIPHPKPAPGELPGRADPNSTYGFPPSDGAIGATGTTCPSQLGRFDFSPLEPGGGRLLDPVGY
ncbi:hypothetical protein GUJ93_ZPchr0495g2769 [Zizania palustris]|uniref:Uncharacterized protein n=1 Tax=Zizania palustris TaxID=103762 RepID=A0A8J5V0B4_ZIZPA|nr:hypothetical protein GUJ93_ZPchr0495g2769 [Zizania palustris]